MKILFFEVKAEQQAILRAALPKDQLYFFEYPLTEATIPAHHNDADIISVWICSHITPAVLDAFNKLKLIITRSTGYDHIAIDEARRRTIAVSYAPFYASVTVAEHTFALILALSRRICHSWLGLRQEFADHAECAALQCRQDALSKDLFQHEPGFDLQGKTIGIIGMGNIGKHVARIAQGFGMQILACDTCTTDKEGVDFVALPKLLAQADIISIHVPLTEATHHLLNKDTLRLIKPGAYLINTARGEIVDTKALVEALHTNSLAGAGLDVLEDERFVRYPMDLLLNKDASAEQLRTYALNRYLIDHPRVIVTPHNAFNSLQSQQRVLSDTVAIIEGFKKGEAIGLVV